MAYVFISYSHKDKEYARKLATELERQHIEYWMDDRINYGSKWPRVIQEKLEGCQAVIVILSTNAYNSDWVQNEIAFAQQEQKVIFPVLLEGKGWVSLASAQYADVRDGGVPPNKYFETIRKQLSSHVGQAKIENEFPKKPQPSAIQLLNEQIVDQILGSITKGSNNKWEIGIFSVGHYVPQKNPPKWGTKQDYILSSKIVNTNLLQQYDEKTYRDYIENEERIAQKEQLASVPVSFGNLEFSQEHTRLRERLNLQVFMSSQFEFSEADVRKFVKKLIDVHKAHNIPASEIKIKAIK
ncbi:MAG: toll/interleukin-1 receptor domain-containing protein [Anaerolineales bacterium]